MKLPWMKSIPIEKTVRGYRVRKLTLGELLAATERIKELPGTLLGEILPEGVLSDPIGWLRGLDEEQLTALIGRLLSVVPRQFVSVMAGLMDLDEAELLADSDLGIYGFYELIRAFFVVNELPPFFEGIRSLIPRRAESITTGGSRT